MPAQNKITNFFSNATLGTVKWAIKFFPRWLVQAVIEVLFTIACMGVKRLNRICIANLNYVYGRIKEKREIKRMSTACIKNIGRTMMDLLYYVEHPKELQRKVRINNGGVLKRALKLGKGVIVPTAHLGNFPLLFVSLVQKGYKVNVIIRPMKDSVFSKFMYGLCAKWNINMIQTYPRRRFLKESLGALKRNELLFILSDQTVPEGKGVKVSFFNHEVSYANGPLLFHERMSSPILPMFIVKDKNENFNIYIKESMKVEKRFRPDHNNKINIGRIAAMIESFVRDYPLQWGGWLNKKWILEGHTAQANLIKA